jgi:hypothetical protein
MTKTRDIEVYRLWGCGTWDTDIVAIPVDTPEEDIAECAENAVLAACAGGSPDGDYLAMTGVYSIPEIDESDEHDE